MKLHGILIFFLFCSTGLFAHSISGAVVDIKTGSVLPGANIKVLSTSFGTSSDANGRFVLKDIEAGHYQLETRFIGFEPDTMQVVLNDQLEAAELVIRLQPGAFELAAFKVGQGQQSFVQNNLSQVDWEFRRPQDSEEMLTIIPGVVTTQHAGGGKADQFFLRGFDLDHGTDLAIDMDGIPVNLPTHAHGQGYADAHFIIPEAVRELKFTKGITTVRNGNFATAGAVSFQLKPVLEKNEVTFEAGSFGTARTAGLFNLIPGHSRHAGQKHNLYLGLEYRRSDGPFELPLNFQRANALLRYRYASSSNQLLDVIVTGFSSAWNASGLIPERTVDQGIISRFGAIDSSETGSTNRINTKIKLLQPFGKNGNTLSASGFYSWYNYDLISNFTFFLNDPVNGDRIRQYEERNILGGELRVNGHWHLFSEQADYEYAAGIRYDIIDDLELSHVGPALEPMEPLTLGNSSIANGYIYYSQVFTPWPNTTLESGIRADLFRHNYISTIENRKKYAADQLLMSPRISAEYQFNERFAILMHGGKGFHTNDSRILLSGTNDVVSAAYGTDLGMIWKLSEEIVTELTAWWMYSEQEIVYSGDGGIAEASGASKRIGIDFAIRSRIANQFFVDGNISLVRARDAASSLRIPLAVWLNSNGGVRWEHPSGIQLTLRFRHLANRPADKLFDVVAEGYFLTDTEIAYKHDKFSVWVKADNLFNQKWKEAQFLTESRLKFEDEPVEEIHFTPGNPLALRAGVKVLF